jgi:TRAP-type transport system periplasmic protein
VAAIARKREEPVRKYRIVAAVAIATLFAVSAVAQELKLGHVGEPESLYNATAAEFARRIDQKLGGKAKITVFGSSQLGGDKEMLQKLKLGTLDFSLPSTIMSSEVDLFGLFEMPYIVRDRAHLARIEKEIFWPTLAPAAEARGYKLLAMWENGFRNVTNSRRPIVVPQDLQGMKLRVPEGKWRVKMFQAYGANPSPMKFSEVFVALQTGVMDAQENPLTQIWSAKFQEVQKYLSMTGHVYAPVYLAMGLKRFNSLPEEVRRGLEEAARETTEFARQTGAREDKALLEKLKAGGMQVNEANKEAFIQASKPIYEEFAQEVKGAKELIEKTIQLGKAS